MKIRFVIVLLCLPALLFAAPAKRSGNNRKKNTRKPTPTYEQRYDAYLKNLAAVEKYNRHVARYTARDISHRVGLTGQVGYSSFFTGGLQYNSATFSGFDIAEKGGIGGGLGFSYQLRYKRLLFTTGLEGQVYTSLNRLSANSNPLEKAYVSDPYATTMLYHYTYHDLTDTWRGAFLQLPLLAGMEFANKKAFFLAGTKIGVGLYGDSRVRSDYSVWASDVELTDPLYDMPNHYLVSHQLIDQPFPLKWNLNVALYGEIGLSLDPYLRPDQKDQRRKRNEPAFPWHMRLSVFAEYGALNVLSAQTTTMVESDLPVYVSTPASDPLDVQVASSLATTTAAAAVVHPFMVGVKLAVYYEMPRRKLKPQRLPKEPKKPTKKEPGVVAEPVVEERPLVEQPSVYQEQEIKKGMTIKIDHLFFATNKVTILPESKPAMQELAAFLIHYPNVSVLIIGHTDDVGSEESNKRLSEGRAREVRNQLVVLGVNPDQLQYEGRGEAQPVATNDTEEGRAQNRRVEIFILDTNEQQIEQLF